MWTALHLLAGLLFVSFAVAQQSNSIQLQRVYEAVPIDRPVSIVIPPDDTNRLFLVQQRGLVKILPLEESAGEAATFLDLSDREMEVKDFEEGLLGLAFHPEYAGNRKFYLYYTQQDPKRSVISEMQVSTSDPTRADPSTERILLEIPQPYWNHNSGNMLFGADGYLYVAVGDGGKANDAARFAQNLFSLNGKILRIDVDSKRGAREYGLPEDNPFMVRNPKTGAVTEMEGTRGEIWCYGMRNPWGLWMDPKTQDFWCADVGQDLFEEINLIEKGGNFGWSYREGAQPFPKRTDSAPEEVTFIDPIHQYPRVDGLSITGGFVYRGDRVPALKDRYVYGDWRFGRIWGLEYDSSSGEVQSNHKVYEPQNLGKGVQPTAFCPDAQGEILVLDWKGGVYRIVDGE